MSKMIEYRGSFIYTEYNNRRPNNQSWRAYCGNESSYSDDEDWAIMNLKNKLDSIMDFKLPNK